MINSSEDDFRDRVAGKLREITQGTRFNDVEISDVRTAYTLSYFQLKFNREADIVCFEPGYVPFLIIETKRDKTTNGFTVLDSATIGQAISYAYIYEKKYGTKVKAIMTLDKRRYAAFVVPENLDDFVDERKLIKRNYGQVLRPLKYTLLFKGYLIETGEFKQDSLEGIIKNIALSVQNRATLRPRFSEAIISLMNEFVDNLAEEIHDKVNSEDYKRKLTPDQHEKIVKFAKGDFWIFSRLLAYILMNKIIAYRVLEGSYQLPHFRPIKIPGMITQTLNDYFNEAMEKTKDFVGIFKTDIFDKIDFPQKKGVLKIINGFIETLENIDVSNFVSYIGYAYENVIPPIERHKLGEFYTPGAIAELIVNWSIRTDKDMVLDPGTGSGTFLAKAYNKIGEMKLGKLLSIPPEIHKQILSQLFGLDINPFSAQLSVLSLALRNISASSNNVNIRYLNFFAVDPEKLDTPYAYVDEEQTPFSSMLPLYSRFDVIVGNPPYTRWIDLDDETKELIKPSVGEKGANYGLRTHSMPGRGGSLPGVFVFWILQCDNLLKDKGRLGLIISDLWLQTSYGKGLQKFLLDNYKITALIDFKRKVFDAPLISTVVLLLEKESDEETRQNNETKFISVLDDVNAESIIDFLQGRVSIPPDGISVTSVKQSRLLEEDAWFIFFKFGEYPDFWQNDMFINISELFTVAKGSTQWHIEEAQGSGADSFFFIDVDTVKKYNLPERYLRPAVKNTRDVKSFILDDRVIETNRAKKVPSYFFFCNESKENIDERAKQYIEYGETECRISQSKGGVLCSESNACRKRGANEKYRYWYNLGNSITPNIIVTYTGWNKTRFTLNKVRNLVVPHNFLTLWYKEGTVLQEEEVLALMSYFNSSYCQLYIELKGRKTGGGAIALEVNIADSMPILDVRKLQKEKKEQLARLFIELEKEAIHSGGAISEDQINNMTTIEKIDDEIDSILKSACKESHVPLVEIYDILNSLIEKRRADSENADNPVIGTEKEVIVSKKTARGSNKKPIRNLKVLDQFYDKDNDFNK